MKLGYFVPEFPDQTHIFFWREIRALRRLGEDVFLLSTRRPSSLSRHEFAAAAIAETRYIFPPALGNLGAWAIQGFRGLSSALSYLNQIEVQRPQDRLRHYALLAAAVDLVQWSTCNQIDHIHGHSCANSAHVLALARRLGGPSYSLTLHGDLAVYGTDHKLKMADASFVSTVGNHLRRQVLEKTGVSEHRVFVTCMGVETSQLAALGEHRIYRSGTLQLTTVARLHPAKGHLHALAAVHTVRRAGLDIRYTIAGDGPFRSAIVSKVDELELSDCVKLTGTLSEGEVCELLSNSDAFVLPSVGLGEAWPVSIMEAMGAGLPVISTMIGATPEMITHGVDGLLVPQADDAALASMITVLAEDTEIRRRIGQAARTTARQRFDVSVNARALRDAAEEFRPDAEAQD